MLAVTKPGPVPPKARAALGAGHLPQLAWRRRQSSARTTAGPRVFDVPPDEAFHYPDGEGGRT
jgi:hypothetical protein